MEAGLQEGLWEGPEDWVGWGGGSSAVVGFPQIAAGLVAVPVRIDGMGRGTFAMRSPAR